VKNRKNTKKCKKMADYSFMDIDGNAIVERIDALLAKRQEKRAVLCRAIGINPGAVTNWCGKKQSLPRVDVAIAIADYLGVSVRWLITGEDDQGLTLEDRNLLVKYNSLDDRGRYEINTLLDAKLKGIIGDLVGEKETSA
jgi:transcriptional regulator with XRE-family HTH domain